MVAPPLALRPLRNPPSIFTGMHDDGAVLQCMLSLCLLAKCLQIFDDGLISRLAGGYLDLEDLDIV